jgi:transposase InsO family protein
MFGRPGTLVVDGAKEFKGAAFGRGCKEYGIAIRPRHRGNVHQGGVVERLIGALNGVIGSLPGRTGRSVADRDGYPSKAKARLTFASAASPSPSSITIKARTARRSMCRSRHGALTRRMRLDATTIPCRS